MPEDVRLDALAYGVVLSVVLVGLYGSSRYSYLLFHSLVEITTIVIGFTLFVLTWNTRRFLTNDCFKVLGIGYGFIAIVDLLHTLVYKGMNVIPGYDANLPTQLWIAARYLQAVTLVAAPWFVRRKVDERALFGVYFVAVAAIAALAFGGRFPDCFVEGKGLTPFKIASEYVITAIMLAALALFHRMRGAFGGRVYALIVISIVCTALSELSFTAYLSVFGFANLLGHFLKLAAFYLIYRALLVTGFREPFSLIFRDLKQAEAALLEAQNALEERIREREAANQDLESFSYSVSHDLRAPLRAIEGFSQILVEDHRTQLDADGQHCVDTIRDSALRMSRLIDDILHFSRTSRQNMTMAPVRMDALVREVFEEVHAAAPDRNVTLRLGDLPPARGDSTMIRQLLVNLLSNALKFTATRAEAVIAVDGTPTGTDEIAYRVKDNGVGFDMKYADKLFGVFQRLHGATEFEGTGIGLAIVKRIVVRHGGRVWAEGKLDEGATIGFTLPRA